MTDNSCPMPPYSSLKRSQKPIRARKKAQKRVGKLGIVRLSGKAMTALRLACWTRDKGRCQECGIFTVPNAPEYYHNKFDMAHIKSRGAGGSDTLDNVRTLCHSCHMKSHTEGKVDAH